MVDYLYRDKEPRCYLRVFSSTQSWAFVIWKATQEFPGTSGKPKIGHEPAQPTARLPGKSNRALKVGRCATA
jgi:hypothetical protein